MCHYLGEKMKKANFRTVTYFLGLLACASALAAGRIQNEDVKSASDITAAVLTTTGNLSSGNACITSIGSLTGLVTGLYVYDTTTPGNISSGTTIAGIPGTCSAGQVQMSTTANGSPTGDTITFGGQISQLINDSKIFVTANSLNVTLASAIATGLIGGSGGGGINLLGGSDNSGFEQGTSQWTASGGTFTSTTSSPLYGLKSALWTASASSQTVYSNLKSLTTFIGLQGANCMGAISYLYTGTSGDYSLVVSDGTNLLGSVSLNANTNPQDAYVTFTCPTSGSLEVGLTSNVSSPSSIKWDGPSFNGGQVLLGSNALLSKLSQASFYGALSFTSTGSCDTGVTSGSLTNFPDGTCTTAATGNIQAFGSTTPGFQMVNAPPGDYYVTLNNGIRVGCDSTATTNCVGLFAFNDGTTTTNPVAVRSSNASSSNPDFSGPPIIGHFTYTTAGTRNIHIQGAFTGTGAANQVEFIAIANGSNPNFSSAEFSVYYFPTQQQQAMNISTTPLSWSGYHPSHCQWQQSSTAGNVYTDFGSTATSCEIVQSTNSNFGTIISQGGVGAYLPGIVWTPTQVGTYQVCATTNGWNASSSSSMQLDLEDTNGFIIVRSGSASGGTGHPQPFTMCGLYPVTNLNQVTFKVRGATSSGGETLVLAEGANNLRAIEWSIISVTQNLPMPVLLGTGGAEVFYTGGNGEGSSQTAVRRFTNARITNGGTDISVTQSSVNGDTFTLNNAGIYAATYCDETTSAPGQQMCLLVNPVGNNSCDTSADANTLAYQYSSTTVGNGLCVSITHKFAAGDKVEARGAPSGQFTGTQSNLINMRIVKISN